MLSKTVKQGRWSNLDLSTVCAVVFESRVRLVLHSPDLEGCDGVRYVNNLFELR